MGERERRTTPRHRRLQLLVGRTAGAVPGALAGGAVALGAGLSVLATALLGTVGAVLGAIAAAPDARRAPRPTVTPLVDGDPTPPHGISVRP
jgi:hypothetical protein